MPGFIVSQRYLMDLLLEIFRALTGALQHEEHHLKLIFFYGVHNTDLTKKLGMAGTCSVLA